MRYGFNEIHPSVLSWINFFLKLQCHTNNKSKLHDKSIQIFQITFSINGWLLTAPGQRLPQLLVNILLDLLKFLVFEALDAKKQAKHTICANLSLSNPFNSELEQIILQYIQIYNIYSTFAPLQDPFGTFWTPKSENLLSHLNPRILHINFQAFPTLLSVIPNHGGVSVSRLQQKLEDRKKKQISGKCHLDLILQLPRFGFFRIHLTKRFDHFIDAGRATINLPPQMICCILGQHELHLSSLTSCKRPSLTKFDGTPFANIRSIHICV